MSQINNILTSGNTELIAYVLAKVENKLIDIVSDIIADNNTQLFCDVLKCIDGKTLDNETIMKLAKSAVIHGRPDILETLLKHQPRAVFFGDELGKTIMDHIMEITNFNEGHMKCVILLINLGSNIGTFRNIASGKKYNLILDFIQDLIKGNKSESLAIEPEIFAPTVMEYNTYMLSQSTESLIDMIRDTIVEDRKKMFHALLSAHPDLVNFVDTIHKSTLIMHAAQYGRFDMIETLLKKGATVADMPTKSALYFAVCQSNSFNKKHIESIKILLKAGSNIDILKNHSMRDYHLIKFIHDKLAEECASSNITLFNKSGITYTIQNPIPIKPIKPIKPKPILIEVISTTHHSKYNIGRLYGLDYKVILCDGSAKEGSITNRTEIDIEIEIPDQVGSYHLLPVDICIDGVKLTKPTVCRFTHGTVILNNVMKSIPEMYFD